MEAVLTQLGLNTKEARFYLHLLGQGAKTASELSRELDENRTNTYMVLDKLAKEQLVKASEQTSIRTYEAADPEKLKALVVNRQQQLRQVHSSLGSILPELSSIYSLGQHKPGVVYFEGLDGYKLFQEDIAKSKPPIDILASNEVPENKEAWEALQKSVAKRKSRGTKARIVFHNGAQDWLDIKVFEKNGYEIRFWGDRPLEGEVAIYGDKVGLTAYQPTLITTVITNDIITSTFQTIFEQIWSTAKKHNE